MALIEKQRDEALGTVKALNAKLEEVRSSNFRASELRGMPIQKLKSLQVSFNFKRRRCVEQLVYLIKNISDEIKVGIGGS